MASLELVGVSVSFGGLRAVDDLSFSVADGSIKGIIGPNGAGKTTLFNAISGIVTPQSGRVLLAGSDITAMRPHQRAALGMSRTFQNLQLFPEMSVLENVMLGAHTRLRTGWLAGLTGLAPREEQRAETLAHGKLAMLGLADRASDPAGDLGFADAKLLEIARALASEPRVLLLDEPIAGVPPADQNRIAQVIRQVNAAGVTIVLVEHNMRVVMNLCGDILVMNHGARLAEGAPASVARNPEVVAAYLGPEVADA
jgi:branched-chain amino acid transport system ATP-binding protein